MKYKNVIPAVFLDRPNRFIAKVLIDGKEEICHVMNTGRMRELLIGGAELRLTVSDNPKRKTGYDLIGVRHGGAFVNIDSIAPNKVAAEYIPRLFPEAVLIRPETFYKKSRFDFYIEDGKDRIFLEVKGVTLNVNGEARFPDAPTERGAKHLRELIEAKNEGFRAAILFVIAMKGVVSFSPNDLTDPNFGRALREAKQAGVEVYAVDCLVTEDSITADKEIAVIL